MGGRYIPKQVTKEKFVQLVYNPDYLSRSSKWRKTISDTEGICQKMDINTTKSEIVLDGGNVVRCRNKLVMCNKVFKENSSYSVKQVKMQLEVLFEVDQIIFIPQDPNDEIGHTDGMVRFLSDDVVLVNDYSKEDVDFQLNVRYSLSNAGLQYIEVPFNPYQNKTNLDATRVFINYVQIKGVVFVPIYNISEDEAVIKTFEDLFKGESIIPILSNEIAKEGGV